jgi:16S rRNA A1518/A1519 N6-dimethyltransferase RsmA/KsgA/DIM1 with predicted DNA glycosylase/AP lyase activity
MMISDLFGVPFVPTQKKVLDRIFSRIKIKKNDVFYDLGCGDGRLPLYISQKYKIQSYGVELNPLLHIFSKLKARFLKQANVTYIKNNLFDIDLKNATIIYLFLFPEVLVRLSKKLKKECKKNTLIISHGFQIKGMKKNLFDTKKGKPFFTYYYRL